MRLLMFTVVLPRDVVRYAKMYLNVEDVVL